MSLTTDQKMFYGSLMVSMDREKILGDQDYSTLRLLRTLQKSLQYAEAQYNAGATSYYSKIKNLKEKISTLKKCPNICKYSERLLLSYSCVNPS